MAWIDYKKAYDMVPHSWILESVTLVGIADNIKRLLKNSTSNWKTNAYGTTLGEVNIRRGIFQGDSLSPLLFVIAIISLRRMLRHWDTGYQLEDGHCKINHLLFMDDLKLYGRNDRKTESLVHTVWIFSEDIGMQFGIEKCTTIKLQRGNVKHTEQTRSNTIRWRTKWRRSISDSSGECCSQSWMEATWSVPSTHGLCL